MNYDAEYKDFFESLGDHGTATYKWFDLFRVNLGDGVDSDGIVMRRGLYWGKHGSDESLDDQTLREIKSYVKAAKAGIRKEKKATSMVECRRRIWFLCQKIIEIGAFDRPVRRDILHWADVANERTLEGCQLRIESVGGGPAFATTAPVPQ